MSNLWEEVKLDEHGLIEAHAGTGKTYTIVRLVLRILEKAIQDDNGEERFIHIREVLLVTYTEKAAGELKRRVRKGLEDRIAELQFADAAGLVSHLESCLHNLHEACIGTIHAVCLRLLRTWPFESGVHFDTEFIDDADGLRSCLRESMRTDWQDDTTCIPWVLDVFAGRGARIDEGYFTRIRETAGHLLDEQFTVLDRSMLHDRKLCDFRSVHDDALTTVNRHRPDLNDLLEQLADALDRAGKTGLLEPDRQERLDIRLPELERMRRGGDLVLKLLRKPCNFGSKKIYTAAHSKKIPVLATAETLSRQIVDHPATAAQQDLDEIENVLLPLAFISDAAEALAQRWKRAKLERGLVSYQDMLKLMNRAVSERPRFTAFLRDRFRCAIIDEFQDTSRLQWEVFRHLFLENSSADGPRLYFVGDPKQSIYSVQGADVQSYLDARDAMKATGGKEYPLTENFRSLEPVIAGCNLIFAAGPGEEDWFQFDPAAKNGITYPDSHSVTFHARTAPPSFPLPLPALQVVPLAGDARLRNLQMAEYARQTIQALKGTTVSVPDGDGWREITLNYADFSVIVEKKVLRDPFLEEFRRHGIPAVTYKMEGVFQSPLARALHALLRAVLQPSGDPAPRLAALLTHFFNRKPEAIDPDHDLEPCRDPDCRGDSICITHALSEWTTLAGRSLWSQFFDRILDRTGIEQRLLRTADGERHLADLRQVVDYCLERLYCDNITLPHLFEHLGSLLDKNISPGRDRNLHVLETQRSSVKILTMHAAKGLEFPVVFVANSRSRDDVSFLSSPLKWTGDDGKTRILPFLYNDKEMRKSYPDLDAASRAALQKEQRERRRLLYVACTRAQALLFVPMHLDHLPEPGAAAPVWSVCGRPSTQADHDLSPRLAALLDEAPPGSSLAVFDPHLFPSSGTRPLPSAGAAQIPSGKYPDLNALDLPSRICRQTSYSQLTRRVSITREADRSEESDEEPASEPALPAAPSSLPGGRLTGDALHHAIEDLFTMEDTAAAVSDDATVRSTVKKRLEANGILTRIARFSSGRAGADSEAVDAACNCLFGALTTRVKLPGGGQLKKIAGLASGDRFPEMEFLLRLGSQWVHGFMDLVFRVPSDTAGKHPWRYYVLDWKSDTLPDYSQDTIKGCIEKRHYNLQARLYCHALDSYLKGILGPGYDPPLHLGGAVYLFLREHERGPLEKAEVWTYAARPEDDREYIIRKADA